MERNYKKKNHPPEVSFFKFGQLIPRRREVNEFNGSQEVTSALHQTSFTSVVEQDCIFRKCLGEFRSYLKGLSDAEIMTVGTFHLGSNKLTRVVMEETGVSAERLEQIKKEVSEIFKV